MVVPQAAEPQQQQEVGQQLEEPKEASAKAPKGEGAGPNLPGTIVTTTSSGGSSSTVRGCVVEQEGVA